jgi:hypothetical protein
MPVLRILIAFFISGSFILAADLNTLAGKKLSGELLTIDDKNIVINTATGPVSTPMTEVLHLDLNAAAPLTGLKFIDVELIDGSLLHCSQFAVKGKDVEVTMLPSLSVKMPLAIVSYVLNEAHEPKIRQEWKEFLEKQNGKTDILAIRRNDLLQDLQGTFGEGDEQGESIAFELTSGKKLKPSLSKIHGMVFVHKPPANPPATICKVNDAHRNLLYAAKLAVAGGKCTVTTVAGVQFEYPDLKLLTKLDYRPGRLEYLSDMEPASIEVSSTEERIEKYRRDKNLDDGPIRLAGSSKSEYTKPAYAKGLILLSRTVLVYNLSGDYKEFKAILGVDAQVSDDTRAKLTIQGDGRELFSGEVTRKDDPKPLTLNIKGVKQLRITVSSELLDIGNHVVLADAKVSK